MAALLAVAQQGRAQQPVVWKLADLQTAIREAKGPTIINFWATFCKPCLAELPHLQAAAKRYREKGVRLLLVSLDLKDAYPKKMNAVTKRLKVTSPVYFLDETDADKFCPAVDSSWSGSIPATLFLNPQTGYRRFMEEELSAQRLEAEIKRLLAQPSR